MEHVSLWKNRSFLSLWMSQVMSNIGDQFYGIALLWYLLQQTQSASTLSLIPIPEMVAGFLFYLIGGVLADRFSPRMLMVGADLARMVIAVLVGLLVVYEVHEIYFFLLTQFFLGIFSTLFYPAKTVALKVLVPEPQLNQANAILDTTFRTIRILAPMLIGLMATRVPLASLFFVNVGSYLLSAAFLYLIREQMLQTNGERPTRLTIRQYGQDIGSAMREVARKRYLFYILLFGNIGFLVWQVCWNVGFPVLANQMGGGDAGMLGVIVGFYGAGNLLGSLFMTRFHYRNPLLLILIGWLIQSAGFLTMALGLGNQLLVFAAASIAGIGGPLIGIPQVTAIQTKVESVNTGKVFALNMLIFTFFSVLSSSLGALWLGNWPVDRMFLVSGMFLLAAAITGWLLDRREQRRTPREARPISLPQ